MTKNFTKHFLFAFAFLFCASMNAQIFTEDFDGGLPADWQAVQMDASPVNASSNWVYSTTGPGGGYATNPIASTTAANGFMLFDSDLNCSQMVQDVWLISPVIDATTYDDVVVTFQTYYQSFNCQFSIQATVDGGANWTEYVPFPNIVANDFAGQADGSENPVEVNVIVSDVAANSPTFQFAFRFLSDSNTGNGGNLTACGYAVQVDDVSITNIDPTPFFDMRTNTNFFAIPSNAMTPATQVDDFGFLCDIENIGQMDASGVNLNVSISTLGSGVLYSQDLDYGTVTAGTLDENRIFPDRYTPPATENIVYDASYTVSMDSTDLAPINNTIDFQFAISDSVFAKEFNDSQYFLFSPIDAGDYTIGNHFYVPNGDGLVCSSVLFAIGNADDAAGDLVNVYLYKWEDVNNDGMVQPEERDGTIGGEIVANSSYVIQASDQDVQIVLENWETDIDDQVRLDDDSHYILALELSEPSGNSDRLQILGARDYSATVFMNDSLDIPRFASFWNPNEIGSNAILSTTSTLGMRIRMHINPEVIVAVDNQLAPENKVNIFPNPVREELNLELDFVETFDDVIIKITDMAGKEILVQNLSNIDQQTSQINTSNFVQGTYTLQVITPNGVRTKRFVVAK